MATAAGRIRCVTCGKEKVAYNCRGCLKDFCYDHLGDHRKELGKQLDEIEITRDLFRQALTGQTVEPEKHVLIEQINQWERDSVNKIRQTAEEARQRLFSCTTEHITEIEVKLNKLTNQLRKSRQEDDFFEKDLNEWNKQLTQLKEELIKPSSITIIHDSTALVNKISIEMSVPLRMPCIPVNAKWIQNGVTVAGGNALGNAVDQLSSPYGLCVDDNQTIYVAEYANNRIMEWKHGATSGQVVADGNGPGNRNNQLSSLTDVIVDKESDSLIISDYGNGRVVRWPRRNSTSGEIIISNIDCYGLTMGNDGYIYAPDFNKHEVSRWKIGDMNGTVVAGGNGQGNRFDQLNGPTYIFVDQDHSVYVSDFYNHRVIKWMKGAKEGVVVAGGQGQGNGLTQLSNPWGVAVDQLDTVYVVDHTNHRVMRWCKGATQGSVVVGGNGQGGQVNQLSGPVGLSFDRQGNLYIVDNGNHRVQKFNIDPSSNT